MLFFGMVILVVFNSFNVVKNLKKPDHVARQKPPFYITISGLLQTSEFNSKVGELENNIKTDESKPDFASKTELKNVENKIPDSSAFVKKNRLCH